MDAGDSNEEILEEARREGIRHGGEFAAPIMDSVVTGHAAGRLRQRAQRWRGGEPARPTPASRWPAPWTRTDRGRSAFGALPAACAALNQVQIAGQRLTVEAAMTGDRDLVHAAVALDPLTGAVQTLPKIREMVDRMLEAEAPWLPRFER